MNHGFMCPQEWVTTPGRQYVYSLLEKSALFVSHLVSEFERDQFRYLRRIQSGSLSQIVTTNEEID